MSRFILARSSRSLHIILAVGGLTLVAAPRASADPSWPMYQGNPSHTGYVPIRLDASRFAVRWQRTLASGALRPVTAADGRVFVTESTWFGPSTGLFALDALSGTTLWTKQFAQLSSVNPPSYAYGNVYVQTGRGLNDEPYVRAYRADTGDLVFRVLYGAQWEQHYAPTIFDGTLYLNGGTYGGMYSVDAFDGTEQWFTSLNQYDGWTPAVNQTLAFAYVGEYSPGLYVLDRLTGSPVFSIPDPDFEWNGWTMNVAPVLGSMNDVLATHDGRLLSFDIANRTIGWQLHGSFTGQPAVAKGVVYVIGAGALNARDEATGALLWAWEPPSGSLEGAIIVTDSHVFARTASATYAISVSTRQSVWSHAAGGHLALSEGTLYIAGGAGSLVAIRLEVLPSPDIKVNENDGPATLRATDPVTVTVALTAGNGSGHTADWWLAAESPYGLFWYSLAAGWVSSPSPVRTYGGPLFALGSTTVLQLPALPPGRYTFHFAVDSNADGVPDGSYWDFVPVVIR